MINLGEAYRKLIENTNKRRCEPHGQIEKGRTKDEEKTKERRTMNEGKTNDERRKDERRKDER